MTTSEPSKHAVHVAADGGDSRLRVQTSVRLRWFAVAGQAATVALVDLWYGFELPVGWCLLAIACSAWVNIYLRIAYPSGHRLSARLATLLLGYDMTQLAALLFMTGGLQNPFTVLLVAPVTVSAATLPPRNTLFLGGFALLATIALAFVHLPLPWRPGADFVLPNVYKLGIFAAVTACLLFLALYAWRLSKEAREMSAALAATELVLAREQRLHALDGLAAAAAHELGTPLATIVVIAKELEREAAGTPHIAEDLKLINAEARRCREILQKLTHAPGAHDPMHAAMTLVQLAEEAAKPHREHGVALVVRQTETEGALPHTERNPGVMFGVGNLIENAVDFAQTTVTISLSWSPETVAMTIADDGPGFQSDVLEQLGTPYLTRRSGLRAGRKTQQRTRRTEGGGLGLGVFIAKTLLERAGATITFENQTSPSSGAVVSITWPRERFEASSVTEHWPGALSGKSGQSERPRQPVSHEAADPGA